MTQWGPFGLNGRNAVVTGAAHGIGYAIAARFLEGGANVIVADHHGDAAAEAVERLLADSAAGEGRGSAVAIEVDVAAPNAGSTLVGACVAAFGSLDILVNNAGIFPVSPMLDTERELFEHVIAVNLTGLAFCSKAAAQQMVEQGEGGTIVNIASIDALHPSMVGLAAYDASKGGVVMLTRSLALELAPHEVRVNAIAPGGVTTEGVQRLQEELVARSGMTPEQLRAMNEATVARIPLQRMGDPDEIATVAVFLASSAARYMTGETIVVDGGLLLA